MATPIYPSSYIDYGKVEYKSKKYTHANCLDCFFEIMFNNQEHFYKRYKKTYYPDRFNIKKYRSEEYDLEEQEVGGRIRDFNDYKDFIIHTYKNKTYKYYATGKINQIINVVETTKRTSSTKGYKSITLYKRKIQVHRIIAGVFYPKGFVNLFLRGIPLIRIDVDHRDCNHENNHITNLKWCSHKYNVRCYQKLINYVPISTHEFKLKKPIRRLTHQPHYVQESRKQKDRQEICP